MLTINALALIVRLLLDLREMSYASAAIKASCLPLVALP